jgi:hypothetical protein
MDDGIEHEERIKRRIRQHALQNILSPGFGTHPGLAHKGFRRLMIDARQRPYFPD